MTFQVGDSVRTAEGLNGKIVVITKDGRSAYVRIIGDETGARATLRPLDTLKKLGDTQ
jgi:preprotein translocase subunit YajC